MYSEDVTSVTYVTWNFCYICYMELLLHMLHGTSVIYATWNLCYRAYMLHGTFVTYATWNFCYICYTSVI